MSQDSKVAPDSEALIGFYDPIFMPILKREMQKAGALLSPQ